MMQSGAVLEREAFAAGLRAAVAPVLSVSEWADRYRVLSKAAASEPGRWSTSRTPYLREIMDCLSPGNPVQEVVFMKPTQIGGTELGLNWVGAIIHQGLGPTMIVLPTSNAAKKASKTRVAPMIADTPVLHGRVRDAKSRDSGNTTLLKEFDGGVLIFAGANSATELKSSPAGNIFLDEIEEYPDDVDGQGDPEELATKRADTFARQKRLKVSTPTVTGGRIDRAYQASDQRKFYVPCPHCAHEQTLRFERLKWQLSSRWEITRHDDGEVVEVEPDTPGAVERTMGDLVDVWYECEACDQRIHEHYKTRMLNAGRWVAHNPGPDRAAGFHLNALYSPIGWFGWRKIVLSWLRAQKDTTGASAKTFCNTVEGLPYTDPGETIDEHWLRKRTEADWRVGGTVPAGALLLCAGVDVQHDRLEVAVWGYGRNAETWLVDVHVLHGSPVMPEVWTALEGLLDHSWLHALGGKLRLEQMAIDAGDGNTTHFVRQFVRKWAPTRRVIAVKGQAVQGKPLLGKPTDQDVNWRGQVIRNAVQLWPVGSDAGKAAFYARLRIEAPGPGYVHLPSGLSEEIFAQLTAEKLITRYVRGYPRREWQLPRGRRNEQLDCRVYADAAAERYGVRFASWDRIEAGLRAAGGDLFAAATEQRPGDGPDQGDADGAEAQTPGASTATPAARGPVHTSVPSARRPRGFVNAWRPN